MSKTHKIVVTTVVTTIATATVLTFTRGDTAAANRIASLPQSGNDAPVVAGRTPGATEPSPTETTPTPKPTEAPKPAAKTTVDQPAKPTTTKPAPTTNPAPSPTPTPRQKNLLEILLGQ